MMRTRNSSFDSYNSYSSYGSYGSYEPSGSDDSRDYFYGNDDYDDDKNEFKLSSSRNSNYKESFNNISVLRLDFPFIPKILNLELRIKLSKLSIYKIQFVILTL